MKKCKYCRSEIDKKTKICPVCGKKQKKPIGLIISIAIIVIITAILVAALSGDDGATGENQSTYETARDVYSGDNLDVSFIRAYEESYVEGMVYVQFDVENTGDRRVVVTLENPVVNGYSTITLSGIPMEIDAGAKNKTPFFYNESNIGMEKLEDLKTIQFNICTYDAETMAKLSTSDLVTIDFNT